MRIGSPALHLYELAKQGYMVLFRSQMLSLLAAVGMFGIVRGHAVKQPEAPETVSGQAIEQTHCNTAVQLCNRTPSFASA